MPPLTSARRKALRAMLSAVAGGGLTAAGLGGPLAGPAMAATPETTTTTAPAAGHTATTPEAGTETTPTTTTTTTIPVPPAPGTTTVPGTSPATAEAPKAPKVVLQRRQKVTRGGPNPSVTKTTGGSSSNGAQRDEEGVRPEQRRGLAAVGRTGRRARGGARLGADLR